MENLEIEKGMIKPEKCIQENRFATTFRNFSVVRKVLPVPARVYFPIP